MFRIGFGYDFHRYIKNRRLFIGGVEIPHEFGLEGHSDADVLIHAICDALLGALSLGDIGKHFPNTDARYHNIASRKLLFEVMKLIQEREYKIVNIDSMVIADHPKLAAHIPKMCTLLSQDLGVQIGDISIKATTKEGCAPEGIAAHAVVLLTRNK